MFQGLWYLALISLTSLLPAALGSEFGFRRLYIRLLVGLFDWATGNYQLFRPKMTFTLLEGKLVVEFLQPPQRKLVVLFRYF